MAVKGALRKDVWSLLPHPQPPLGASPPLLAPSTSQLPVITDPVGPSHPSTLSATILNPTPTRPAFRAPSRSLAPEVGQRQRPQAVYERRG